MQFEIDESLPIEIAELLITSGYDAKTVNDQQLQGTIDPVLAKVCKSEHRVLVTLDVDFPTLGHIHQKNFRALLFYGLEFKRDITSLKCFVILFLFSVVNL